LPVTNRTGKHSFSSRPRLLREFSDYPAGAKDASGVFRCHNIHTRMTKTEIRDAESVIYVLAEFCSDVITPAVAIAVAQRLANYAEATYAEEEMQMLEEDRIEELNSRWTNDQ
jgi:hypothetical protein